MHVLKKQLSVVSVIIDVASLLQQTLWGDITTGMCCTVDKDLQYSLHLCASTNTNIVHLNSRGKSVSDNLRMSNPLLSRFDLIFIVLDCPDTDHDRMLSRHIIQQMQSSSSMEGLERRNRPGGCYYYYSTVLSLCVHSVL